MKRFNREKTDSYNAQPTWSLRDIQIGDSSEPVQVVEEFLRLVEFTAAEFCWALNRPLKNVDWKRHSWKHTNFAEIERIIADVNAGRWLPPQLAIDQLGSFEEAQALFRRAQQGEAGAVARIASVFPSLEDKNDAARHLFGLNDEDAIPPIPSVPQLAAQLAEIVIRNPDSQKAHRARRDASLLLSKQAAKGSRPQGGRPPSPHHEEVVTTIWMMSYAVCKQAQQVLDFLQNAELDEQKCRAKMGQWFPWFSSLMQTDYLRFLQTGTTQSALALAAKLLAISPSKIAKIVHSSRSLS